ncbi:MAG: hypothetical protein ACTSUE_25415 [Promethearchaeota archaeon]
MKFHVFWLIAWVEGRIYIMFLDTLLITPNSQTFPSTIARGITAIPSLVFIYL